MRAETHLYLNYSVPSPALLANWDRCSLPVVSAEEAEKFISALGQIPAHPKDRARPERLFLAEAVRASTGTYEDAWKNPNFDFSSHDVEVSYQTEMTLRFALLASSRWRKEQGAFLAVYASKKTGREEIVEIELNDNAHGVLFIYRLSKGGIGVVMTMKGSSFAMASRTVHDWYMNADTTLSAEPGMEGKVHNGFRLYRKRILGLMERTSLEKIRPLIEEWAGRKVEEDNLKDWLYNGDNWKWAFFTGHSMGAGMAQIEAVSLAARLNVVEADRKVFLANVESPKVGTAEFVRCAEERVSPHGGLNVEKLVDVFTHIGVDGGLSAGMRVSPATSGMTWRQEHAYFHVPATVNGRRGIVRFSTVCAGSRGVGSSSGCTSAGCRREEPNSDIWMNDRLKYDVHTAELFDWEAFARTLDDVGP